MEFNIVMVKDLTKIGQRFLNEITKEDNKTPINLLETFMQNLEEKEDPTYEEIKLIEDIYNFMEKYSILCESMKKYIREKQTNPESDTLFRLISDRNKRYPW